MEMKISLQISAKTKHTYILLYFLGKPALQNSQEKEKEKSKYLT